jgi:hypothetical protein
MDGVSVLAARSGRLLAGLIASIAIASGPLMKPGSTQELRLEPAKVMGPDACGECHKKSVAVWKLSHHATTFKDLPRKKEAREIADKLGLKRIKAESDCLSCHFTSAEVEGKVKAIAGIGCESCHGASKDWIKTHSDFGGKDVTVETESPDHKKERYAKSEAAGMIRPIRLYEVAANCYGCHTVPNEKLVNVGGHAAGSKFELVSWSQGEVRHNVWYSKENNAAAPERKRMMYIIGKTLDLEYALRGVAKATTKDTYATSMARRAKAAREAVEEIAQAVELPELDEIVAVAAEAKLKLNNEANLAAAADKIAAAARKIAHNYDGSQFAALDPLIPGPDKHKGTAGQ